MIKLFVSDLDGTLFNDDKIISAKNLEAIKEIYKQGHHFMIATGRDYYSVITLREKYGIQCGAITLNGAQVYSDEGEILCETPIAYEAVEAALRLFDEYGCLTTFRDATNTYVLMEPATFKKLYLENMLRKGYALDEEDALKQLQSFQFFDHMKETSYEELKSLSILQIKNQSNPFYGRNNELEKKLEAIEGLQLVPYASGNIEITAKGVTKGVSLKRAIKRLGLKLEEVMPFGDGNNDFEMLAEFPNSYAMCNAEADLHKVSGNITSHDNNHDGVGITIIKVLESEDME